MASKEDLEQKVNGLKEKLRVNNSSIQRGGIQSFVNVIKGEKRSDGEAPKSYSILIDECLMHPSPLVVEASLQGIECLVKEKIIPMETAIDTLINNYESIPSVCIELVLRMIIKFLQSNNTDYPSDMLVSLSRRRSETFIELLGFCGIYFNDLSWISLLGPLFSSILHSSIKSGILFHYRSSLLNFLIQQITILVHEGKDNHAWNIVKFLSKQLDYLSISDTCNLLFYLDIIGQLVSSCNLMYSSSLLSKQEYFHSLQVYFSHITSIWIELHCNTLESIESLQLTSSILQENNNTSSIKVKSREIGLLISLLERIHNQILLIREDIISYNNRIHFKNVLIFGYMLTESTEANQLTILKILDSYLIPSISGYPFAMMFVLPKLIYPLLQVMSTPSESVKSLAGQLLYRIEKFTTSKPKILEEKSSNIEKQLDTILCSGFSVQLNYIIDWTLDFYSQSISDNSNSLINRLSDYIDNINSRITKDSIHYFFIFWIAPFLFHSSPDIRFSSCKLFKNIANLHPESAISLLPFLLYQSGKEHNSLVQYEILKCIPQLGNHSQMLTPVFKVLSPLLSNNSLKAFGIRLFCQLWKLQDKVFRKFQGILITNFENDKTEEVRIAVSSSIRDICQERPTRGMEFISQISTMIKDSNELVKTYGLQALTHLCISDCVEFSTAWKLIKNNIENDNRTIIIQHQMKLFESGLENLNIEDDFTLFQISELWKGALSEHSSIRNESYRVLNLFFEKEPLLITLQRTHDEYLPIILDTINECNINSLKLSKTILNEESGKTRKQIEVSVQGNKLYNALLRMGDYLDSSYIESARPTIANGLAGASLWSFKPILKKKSQSEHGEKLVIARAYRLRLNDLLQDVFMNTWITRVIGMFGWFRFTEKYFNVLIEAEKAKIELQKENNETIIEEDYYKKTINELQSILSEKRNETPATAENCIIALTGFTLALPVSKHELIEQTIDYLQSLLKKEDANEREKYACYISLACLTHSLPLSDFNRIKDIYLQLVDILTSCDIEWIKFAASIGIGIIGTGLLQKLKDHIQGEQAQQSSILVLDIKKLLIEKITNSNEDSKVSILGCCLGISYLSASLSNVHELSSLLKIFKEQVNNEKSNTRSIKLSGICLSLSSIVLRCFRLNLITNDKMKESIDILKELSFPTTSSKGNIGACIALGSLTQGSILYGYNSSQQSIDNIIGSYISLCSSSQLSDSLREACLLGLCNSLGANLIIPTDGTIPLFQSSEYLLGALNNFESFSWSDTLPDILQNLFENTNNSNRLHIFSAWMMGTLARPLPPRSFSTSTSSLLEQLPEKSLLKSILLSLHENYDSSNEKQVSRLLEILSIIPARKLPLIDWTPLLIKLIKGDKTLELRKSAFKFAIQNCTNSSVAHLLSCSLEIGDFQNLPIDIQLIIFHSLPEIIDSFATNRSIQILNEHSVNMNQIVTKDELLNDDIDLIIEWGKALSIILSNRKLSKAVLDTAESTFHSFIDTIPLPIIKDENENYPYVIDTNIAKIYANMIPVVKDFSDKLIGVFFDIKKHDYTELNIKKFIWNMLLVKNTRLPITKLISLRSFCFSHPDISFGSILILWMIEAVYILPDISQRQLYQDCIDCMVVLKNPLVIIRFISWISLQWTSFELDSLIFNNIVNDNEDVNYSLSFMAYSIERILPFSIGRLLYKFDKLFPQQNIIQNQIALLKQKDKELQELIKNNEENEKIINTVRIYLLHSIKLLQRHSIPI